LKNKKLQHLKGAAIFYFCLCCSAQEGSFYKMIFPLLFMYLMKNQLKQGILMLKPTSRKEGRSNHNEVFILQPFKAKI